VFDHREAIGDGLIYSMIWKLEKNKKKLPKARASKCDATSIKFHHHSIYLQSCSFHNLAPFVVLLRHRYTFVETYRHCYTTITIEIAIMILLSFLELQLASSFVVVNFYCCK